MHTLPAPVHRPLRRRLALAGALVAACLASAAVRAQDDPPGRVGRVAEIAGEVRTINPEGAWDTLVRNQPLSTGDRITTDKTGRATLQFGSTIVRVGADSDLQVTQLDDQKIRLLVSAASPRSPASSARSTPKARGRHWCATSRCPPATA